MTSPTLSICIPTYENAENLGNVLRHVLTLSDTDVEFVVSDDGSTDGTEEVVSRFEDDRLVYYRNSTNLGFEKNLLTTVDRATGRYVMPLADEDKLEVEVVSSFLSRLRDDSTSVTTVLGDFEWEGNWTSGSWSDHVQVERCLSGGRESLLGFVREVPHPFAEHTWRRNYIGGFILKADALDLDQAAEYYGSSYIHNVLIIQSLLSGQTILTPDRLCVSHFFQYEGENRFWKDNGWQDLDFRVRLQKYRMKLVDDIITDSVAYEEFIATETRFAAHLAAWSLYSKSAEYKSVRSTALSPDIRSLTDIWTSHRFYRWFVYCTLVLPLPAPFLKRSLSHGYVARRAAKVWQQLVRRAFPEPIPSVAERVYENRILPFLSRFA